MVFIVVVLYVAVLILNLMMIQALITSGPWRLVLSISSFIPGWQQVVLVFLLILKFFGRS